MQLGILSILSNLLPVFVCDFLRSSLWQQLFLFDYY
jgi:hypothetical protein